MKVKAIQPHGNPHGSAFWKEAGAVYELPEVEAPGLIAAGLVEEVKKARARKRGNADAD